MAVLARPALPPRFFSSRSRSIGVEVEHARTEAEFADEAGAGVLGRLLEIVDGGVEIVLDVDAVGRDSVSRLMARADVRSRRVRSSASM